MHKIEIAVIAAFAFKLRLCAVFGQGSDGRGIPAALRAVDAYGVIPFLFTLDGILCPEGIEDIKYLPPFPQRRQDMPGVIAPAVFFSLMAVIQLDAEFTDGGFELVLKVHGVVFVVRIKGVGYVHIGAANVFFHISAHFGYIDRHFPHPVKLVP